MDERVFPLHVAAACGDLEKLKELLQEDTESENGENSEDDDDDFNKVNTWREKIDKRDSRGVSPLQIAVLGGFLECASYLLEAGANISSCFGFFFFFFFSQSQSFSYFFSIFYYCLTIFSPFFTVKKRSHIRPLQFCVLATILSPDEEMRNASHEFVALFLQNGLDPLDIDRQKQNILHTCAYYGASSCIPIILEKIASGTPFEGEENPVVTSLSQQGN